MLFIVGKLGIFETDELGILGILGIRFSVGIYTSILLLLLSLRWLDGQTSRQEALLSE